MKKISTTSITPCTTKPFSRPAQRSLTLRPARSRSRHATLYTESSDSFVASAAVSIATGWSEPVPGRELHPLKSSAFHGALLRQLSGTNVYWAGAMNVRREHLVQPICALLNFRGLACDARKKENQATGRLPTHCHQHTGERMPLAVYVFCP